LGYQIVAVSPDKPEKLAATKDKQATTYTLVSDNDATGIKGFGIAYRMDAQTFDTYKNKYKIDLEEYSGAKRHLLPTPAVFIPDYKVRLHPEILLAAAKAYAKK
jgi:peroxiredoxin